MKYRLLGKTNLSVSSVGLGTWQFAGVWGKNFEQYEVDQIIHRASELGINFIDTAECYGNHTSEAFIGNAIKATGSASRDQWIIAPKFGHNHRNGLDGDENYQPAQVLLQLEASLKALKTDYIDLYQLHSATRQQFENDKLWTMLDKQVQAGKIRFLGNSIGNPSQLHQAQRSCDYNISVLQTVYNRLNTKAEETMLAVCKNQNMGCIARVPLNSGFLSGKYQAGHIFADNDVRSSRPQDGVDRQINEALKILKEEKPEGLNPATWAIAWCLKHPQVSTVIPGCKSVEQLEINAAAADILLT